MGHRFKNSRINVHDEDCAALGLGYMYYGEAFLDHGTLRISQILLQDILTEKRDYQKCCARSVVRILGVRPKHRQGTIKLRQ